VTNPRRARHLIGGRGGQKTERRKALVTEDVLFGGIGVASDGGQKTERRKALVTVRKSSRLLFGRWVVRRQNAERHW